MYIPKTVIQLTAPIQNIHWAYQILNSLEYKILQEEYSEKEVNFTIEIQQNDYEKIYLQSNELGLKILKI
ncbi:MAG: hypothetical protein KatS3mg035_1985 [Bacteroidia bacterium]|nr:MAG: hypothetical protein KatS3mg035_1985 [Bacteroidia bacterium]